MKTMEFLNKPMSEVWKATKRTFNEIMELNNSDLSASGSGNEVQQQQALTSTCSTSVVGIRSPPPLPIHIPAEKSNKTRFKSLGKTTSLPRLQRPSLQADFEDFDVIKSYEVDEYDGNMTVSVGDCTTSTTGDRRAMLKDSERCTALADSNPSARRSRLSDSGHSLSVQPRNRYRSNSSDRASMRNRNEEVKYHRSTSYDKAMENNSDDEEEEEDQSEKMKTKLMAMWNNMKYGWTMKSKTAFSLQKPIWFLGKCYQHRPSDPEPVLHPGMDTVKSPQMELFKQDFTSRIWMTYRREFPQLEGSTLTTDCGWGCMLRSGQMLLAQCLVTHFLGRDWNIYKEQTEEMDKFHHEIIRWFGDQPSDMSPFSVHRLVDIGKHSGKKAGDWYGPASVAHILRDAMDTAPELNPLFEQVCVYVAQDCTVYKQDVINMCHNRYRGSPQPVYKDKPVTYQQQDSTPGIHNGPSQCCTQLNQTDIGGPCSDDVSTGSHIPVRNATRMHSTDSDCSDVKQSCNTSDVTQTLFHHATSERTISLNTFGYSNSNGIRHINSNQAHYSQSNTGNQASHNASRTKSETKDIDEGSDMTALPRRNAVKEFKHSGVYAGNKSSKTNLKRDKTTSTDQQYLQKRCNSQAHSHSSSAHEQIWRRRSEDINLPSQWVGFSSKSRETDINGSCTHIDSADNQPKQIQLENTRTGAESKKNNWCAVILLVPVRLGGDEINPIYIRPLRTLFTLDSCMGIIGGRPKHSLYYVGFQDEKLIQLDPHYCQAVVDMKSRTFPTYSFHCMSPRKMRITNMDPSCTVGFYLKTEEDFEEFCNIIPETLEELALRGIPNSELITLLGVFLDQDELGQSGVSTLLFFETDCDIHVQVVTPTKASGDYPMFIVRQGNCTDWQDNSNESEIKKDRFLRIRHIDQDGRLVAPMKESEDFVFLES